MEEKEEKKGSISMVEANLPPGFRFHPRDDELVCDYLMRRTVRSLYQPVVLIDVDFNKCEPWDIPQMARVGGKEWYFYSQKDRKYTTGHRANRATATGYWKATGKDRAIQRNGSLVGMRKTLVFYRGRAPKGRKTDWVMHEFRLQETLLHHTSNSLKEEWVLCRVFHKNSNGPDRDDNTKSSSNETASAFMDSYINFDHHIINQHVPCFSNNLSENQTNESGLVSKNSTPLFNASPDQMILRTLLSQLTKKVKKSESYGEGSSESQLTNIGIPSPAWNYYV